VNFYNKYFYSSSSSYDTKGLTTGHWSLTWGDSPSGVSLSAVDADDSTIAAAAAAAAAAASVNNAQREAEVDSQLRSSTAAAAAVA
jgi:hypothetical protein